MSRLPLKMDDGSRHIFDAYRVHYNDALGPCRDGTRITPDLDLDEVKALGLLMCIKHAAGNIPAGGGKGGIAADPARLSDRELERLCRSYIRALRPQGPAYDIPGADIGTSGQTMAWMLDEHETINGYHCPPAISDKPLVLGGDAATGRGVYDVTVSAAEYFDITLSDASVVIQGFGQVGSVAASCFHEAGIRVVAVSDISGAIFKPDGLDIPGLKQHVDETGSVEGFQGADTLSNSELLECECTILVPAAIQGVIGRNNADRIKAGMLVEGANAPTSFEADAILARNGVGIVPDIIANSGSVHVCQMERSQGLYDNYWDAGTIETLRRERVLHSYHQARETAKRHGVESDRLGAWINALRYTEEVIHTRGWL